MATLEAWVHRLQGIKARLNQLPELHQKMDHYIEKVATMEEEKSKRASKQTPETPSQEEALQRNHEKLNAAKQDYQFALTLTLTLTLIGGLPVCSGHCLRRHGQRGGNGPPRAGPGLCLGVAAPAGISKRGR